VRLERTVAIKILAPTVAADSALRDRLQQEARAISRLNHPHICALYDVGDAEIGPGQAVSFLVLELIEGETLAHRLERGPLPLESALAYAVQIADAVCAAHRAGVVHGDLKPANVMISPSGVKLLDFGVSRMVLAPGPGTPADGATRTQPLTTAQPVLGTLHYLAPEQLEGRAPDVRTDIHAAGAVIYEMVTGRRAFDGETAAAVIAAIVRHTPAPMATVVPETPPALEHVVATCLAKNPDERWQHAGDLMRALRWIASGASAAAVASAPRRRSTALRLAGVAAVVVLIAAAAMIYAFAGRDVPRGPFARTSILLPDGLRFPVPGPLGGVGRFALSPDGERLVFVATDSAGTQQLWLRPLASLTASPIAGTEGASSPFWDPQSRRIAFIAQGQLKTIDPSGGTPVVVAAPAFNTTGAWSRDDTIYFSPTASSGLHRVRAAGGPTTPVTTLDRQAGELLHRNPLLLPDGRHLLYTSVTQKEGEATGARGIYVASLEGREPPRLLIPGGTSARVTDGHVIFLRDNALVAQRLDLDTMTLTDAPRPIAERVELIGPASAAFSVSETGMLAYLAAGDGSRLVWVNREGQELGTAAADPGGYGDLEMSRDGERAVVSVTDPSLNTRDLWVVDLTRGVRTRLTFDRAEDVAPVWSPDGSRVLFASNRRGHFDLYQKPASGVVAEQLVLGDDGEKYPMSWASDGESALYWEYDGDGTRLAMLPLAGEQDPQVFLEGRVSQGRLSPDGRWVVYDSAESGRTEVYVVPYPTPTRRWQVSVAGGSLSRWRADGREIFYVARDNKLMAASVEPRGGDLAIGNAQALFDARPVGPRAFYAPAPDGQRFLVNKVAGDSAPAITLLQNWSQALVP
jgi:Tol biopolymer transport system component